MRRLSLLFALILTAIACEAVEPVTIEGSFSATFAASKTDVRSDGQIVWSVGDKVVLSNCTEDLRFEAGELVACAGAECFTVTSEMISADGLTIDFCPCIAASGSYVILTGRDLSPITGVSADGAIQMVERTHTTTLNYLATATSTDGRFNLEGVSNIFSISIVDSRIRYFDVSVGFASFELELTGAPVTCYFPLAPDERISDGAYAYAYDKSCEKLFSQHYDLPFRANHILDFGPCMDAPEEQMDILKQIMTDNDEVEATYNLEGEILKRYLDEVRYDGDYSYTKIKDYVPRSMESSSVRPAYVSVKGIKNASKIYFVSDRYEIQTRPVGGSDQQTIYDLIPGRTYRYGVVSVDSATGEEKLLKKGCIVTEGRIRVIKTKTMHNVRDVGGWEGLDGKHIKYGILFRGGEVIDNNDKLDNYEPFDYEAMMNHAQVTFDMDFRTDDGAAYVMSSPLGIEFQRIPLSAYDSIVLKKDRWPAFKKAILKFIKNAREGKVTYAHCQGGADRTGTFVFFIEGLLGVSDSDLCKDYEITSFYYHKERNDPERYLPMVQALLKNYSDDGTVGGAIYNCSKAMGITDKDIQELRDLMLE